MIYELRTYEIAPGKMKAIADRFANITIPRFFGKYGVKPVMFWETVFGVNNHFVYLLEWDSLAEREKRWDAFTSDPEWIAARNETEKDGVIVLRISNVILRDVPHVMASVRRLREQHQ